MKFTSIREILNFAIEKEVEAVDFYFELHKNEKMKHHESLFLDFANEETKHKKLLEDLRDSYNDGGEISLDTAPVENLGVIEGLKDIEYLSEMDYRDTLILAMKREERAVILYENMTSLAFSETSREVIRKLATDEKKHLRQLENMHDDYMAKRGD